MYGSFGCSNASLDGPAQTGAWIRCERQRVDGHAHPTEAAAGSLDSLDVRPDFGRAARKGVPEVILTGTKNEQQIIDIARAFLDQTGRAILSRLRPGMASRVREAFAEYQVDERGSGRIMAVHAPDYVRPCMGGCIAVITAGTSDVPVAEEARLIAQEMGCDVATLYDVGVAGLHRLLGPLRDLLDTGVDALVVAAGMDGALPSVVAGLAPVPVIGLPTSVGYGAGGRGRAALLSMLQTCAPGLVVVNIDNGVGAGATAALIANRVAQARRDPPSAGGRQAQAGT
jgi:pyridinium-3,5-biscarboxylic acid mononucleotide synthase